MTMAPQATNLPATTTTLDPRFGLKLTEGERVLVEGTPMRDPLFRYFMVCAVFVCAISVIGILALPIVYFALRAYIGKHRYWVTNSRIIVTNGIIGFRARSIPLERVSDVAISCTWLEKAFGLRSVVVRDMTGEAMSGARMLAITDAPGMQQLILDRVHQVNRRPGNAHLEDMSARSYREIESSRERSDMLELLRRIEANTRPGTR